MTNFIADNYVMIRYFSMSCMYRGDILSVLNFTFKARFEEDQLFILVNCLYDWYDYCFQNIIDMFNVCNLI